VIINEYEAPHRAGSGTHQRHEAVINEHRGQINVLLSKALGFYGVGKLNDGDLALRQLDQHLRVLRQKIVTAETQAVANRARR